MKPGASASTRGADDDADFDFEVEEEEEVSVESEAAAPEDGGGDDGVYEPDENGVEPGASVSCTYCCRMRRCAGERDRGIVTLNLTTRSP